jgi:hypothetical protein
MADMETVATAAARAATPMPKGENARLFLKAGRL